MIVLSIMVGCWCQASELGKLLTLKVEKRLVYETVLDRFRLKDSGEAILISSMIGKPIQSRVMKSPDGEVELNWVLGSKNQKWVLVIGVFKGDRVFLVSAVPSTITTSYSYAEYPIWIPLDGSRIMWWGLGSRECSIINVKSLLENLSSGFHTQEGRNLAFQGYDAIDPVLDPLIMPYKFKALSTDESSGVSLMKNDRKLEVKGGFIYSWVMTK